MLLFRLKWVAVESLQYNATFQAFLDQRLNYQKTWPIEELLAEIEMELTPMVTGWT